MMKAVWKKAIALLLLTLVLPGCGKTPAPLQESSATAPPVATLAPTAAAAAEPAVTAAPTLTPSPTPTASRWIDWTGARTWRRGCSRC